MSTDDGEDDDVTRERDILSCGEIDESGNIEIDLSCADKSGKSFGNEACKTAGDERWKLNIDGADEILTDESDKTDAGCFLKSMSLLLPFSDSSSTARFGIIVQ